MKSSRAPVYIMVTFSMFIWGISYILLEILYEYFTPVTTVCLRIMIATVFMILLTLIAGRYQKIARKDIRIFMLFALVDPVAYFLCESYGLKLSSPTTAAVIIATIPLFTPIAAAIMTNEKVTLLNFTGIIVSFTGVLLVIVTKDFKMTVAPLGLLLLFGAVLCAVIYNFFMKNLTGRYNVYMVITTQNVFSTIYFLPILFIYGLPEIRGASFDFRLAGSLFGLSVFASAIAFIFYAKGIQEIGITKTNVFTNMIPVFTALFAFMVLSEEMTILKLTGIGLVIIGLFFAQGVGIKKNHRNISA